MSGIPTPVTIFPLQICSHVCVLCWLGDRRPSSSSTSPGEVLLIKTVKLPRGRQAYRDMHLWRMDALVVASLLLALLHGQKVLAQLKQQPINAGLLPPVGNSEALVSQCRQAYRAYLCVKGRWHLQSSFADLVSDKNSSLAVGNYTFTNNGTTVSEWHLLNSMSDQAESGLESTVLCGKVIFSSGGDQLLVISSRNLEGFYSYIRTSSRGGLPPRRACQGREKVTVPFISRHTFYTQDRVPPPTGALALSSKQRPMQSLFSSGSFNWTRVAEGKWALKGGRGNLWECPGGTPVGSITIRPNSVITWSVKGPYGWSVTGTRTKFVSKAPQDWPWQLYTVRRSQGSQLLGKTTYVHFISTRGGMPPRRGAALGATFASPFSAISWFYTTM